VRSLGRRGRDDLRCASRSSSVQRCGCCREQPSEPERQRRRRSGESRALGEESAEEAGTPPRASARTANSRARVAPLASHQSAHVACDNHSSQTHSSCQQHRVSERRPTTDSCTGLHRPCQRPRPVLASSIAGCALRIDFERGHLGRLLFSRDIRLQARPNTCRYWLSGRASHASRTTRAAG